jgi:hypothetical protein
MAEVVDKFGSSSYVVNQATMAGTTARTQPTSDPGSPYVQRSMQPGRILGGRNLSSAQAAMQRPVELGTPISKGTSGSSYDYSAIYGQ